MKTPHGERKSLFIHYSGIGTDRRTDSQKAADVCEAHAVKSRWALGRRGKQVGLSASERVIAARGIYNTGAL